MHKDDIGKILGQLSQWVQLSKGIMSQVWVVSLLLLPFFSYCVCLDCHFSFLSTDDARVDGDIVSDFINKGVVVVMVFCVAAWWLSGRRQNWGVEAPRGG